MREILSQRGFSEEEIRALESREDYAEVRERVEQLQADRLMDELETRITARVESEAGDLENRWERFKTAVLAINQSGENGAATETLEDMRNRLEAEATERVDATIRSQVASIPLIGNWLAETLIEQRQSLLTPPEGLGGRLTQGIALFIASFFGLKGVFTQFQEQLESARNATLPEVETPNIPDIEVSPEIRSTAIYTAGIELIMGLSEEDNNTTEQLFTQREVKESSYSTILSEGFELEGISENDILALQATLRSQEEMIDSILAQENPDWRTMRLVEIFEEIGVYGESIASLENINPEDIISGNFSVGNLSLEGGAIGGTLGTLFERYRNSENSVFHGVSTELFVEIVREDRKKIHESDVQSLFANNSFDSENDTNFETQFITFGRGFIDVMANDFYIGPEEHRAEFEQFIRDRSLNYKEVLEFMILTGGSLDAGSYNQAVKTLIYTKVWRILGEDQDVGNSLRANTYDATIRGVISGNITEGIENIPPQFINLGNRLLGSIREYIEAGAERGIDIFGEIWNILSPGEKTAIIATGGLVVLALFRSRIFRARASGIGMGLQIGIIGAIMFMSDRAFASPQFRASHPEITTEEGVINLMLIQASENGVDLSDGVERLRSGELGFDIDHSLIIANGGSTETEIENPAGAPEERPSNYRSFMFNPETLENDGMEIIPAQGDIYTQTHGRLTIQKDRRNLEVTFLLDGEPRNTYFRAEGGYWEGVSDNVIANSIFVRNESGEVHLAIYKAGLGTNNSYVYISLRDLEQQIIGNEGQEILIAEDLYLRFDLMMNNG